MRDLLQAEIGRVSGGFTSLLDHRAAYVSNGTVYDYQGNRVGSYSAADAFALAQGMLVPNAEVGSDGLTMGLVEVTPDSISDDGVVCNGAWFNPLTNEIILSCTHPDGTVTVDTFPATLSPI